MSFFGKIKNGLRKTRSGFTRQMDETFSSYEKIDDQLYEELEEILIMADVGVETSLEIVEQLRARVKEQKLKHGVQARQALKEILIELLQEEEPVDGLGKSSVILVIGVNGVGKTTSIGKLAFYFKSQGKKVILGAADTFRAAAIEQLEAWAERVDCQMVKHEAGSDPAAVIFDTIAAAKRRGADVAICDTAGRLHNKKNLMAELSKITRVVEREAEGSHVEKLLVLDAATGQNGVQQAKEFQQAAGITGVILTKLDGTAKGGVVISVKHSLGLPVRFIGVGEKIDDLQPFRAKEFVDALFDSQENEKEDVE